MLELGKAGSAGVAHGVVPVLREGAVVATLRASNWRERATATIDGVEWVYAKVRRELTGRPAKDPEGSARFRARQVSVWKGVWEVDLEGTAVEARIASWWRTTHHYLIDGVVVAESRTASVLSQRPTLDVTGSLTLPQMVFLLWVELVIRRRAAAASAA
jgi:hypothetical protein